MGSYRERVAVVTHYFPIAEQPWRGHSAYQTVRALSKFADVKVFATYPQYPRWLLTKHMPVEKIDKSYKPAGANVEYLQYRAIPGISRLINARVAASAIEPAVRQFQPTVILSYWIYPDGGAAVRVGRRLGVPVIVKSIGSDLNRLDDPIVRACARSVLKEADVVTTVSEALRGRAIELGAAPEKVVSILNGCDSSIFNLGDRSLARRELNLPADAELVLYVGRLDMRKGLGELVTAVGTLALDRSRLQLAIVGDGYDKPALEGAIRDARIQDRVRLVSAVPSSLVARWICASNLVALPSYAEGCPNVIVEALASGRAVVATNVGGIPELLDDHCGIMVPPLDVHALTRALERALCTPFDEAAIARQYSRSWDHVALDLMRIFDQVHCIRTQQAKSAAVR